MFADMIPALESAEHFIFIEYFIIGLGRMWGQIHEILVRKAAQGVDVRVIYDDVGSVSVLPIGYWSKLEEEGIHSLPFNPFVPVVNLVMNNRDHRKIMVIDGHTAFSGGANLADEYINQLERFGHWRDTGVRLQGDAAWSFTIMFLEFWNANRPTDREFEHFRPQTHLEAPVADDGLVQPFADSPVDRESVLPEHLSGADQPGPAQPVHHHPLPDSQQRDPDRPVPGSQAGGGCAPVHPRHPGQKDRLSADPQLFSAPFGERGQDFQLHAGISAQQDLADG